MVDLPRTVRRRSIKRSNLGMTIWVQIDRDAAHLFSASSASRFQVFEQTPQFTRRVPTAGRSPRVRRRPSAWRPWRRWKPDPGLPQSLAMLSFAASTCPDVLACAVTLMQTGFLRYSSNSSISIGSKVSSEAGVIQSSGQRVVNSQYTTPIQDAESPNFSPDGFQFLDRRTSLLASKPVHHPSPRSSQNDIRHCLLPIGYPLATSPKCW